MFHLTRTMTLLDKLTSGKLIKEAHLFEELGIGALEANVSVEDVLTEIAEELWKDVPVDADSQVLILFLNNVYVEDAGFVELGEESERLQVRIDPAGGAHLEGSVCIGYGHGNLE